MQSLAAEQEQFAQEVVSKDSTGAEPEPAAASQLARSGSGKTAEHICDHALTS